jgi:D-alanyl-lipoteichoic acid acyltransferase DltB (MBOAT superfamily)
MLFNSYPFLLVFLPLTLAGFYALHAWSRQAALWFVTAASAVFYGYWNPLFLPLIAASILVNWAVAHRIARGPRTAWLVLGIAIDLGVLGYFKYSRFFFEVATGGAALPDVLKDVILPLGISFYTFEQIAYLVDVWRGRTRPARLDAFAFFVLFFPHLIAGPIILYSALYKQYARRPRAGYVAASCRIGLILLAIGLFKKVVIADSLAPFVDHIFAFAARPDYDLAARDAWIGALGYSLQLYFDFSAYSDMALGLARMVGIRLPVNFNSPYRATGFIDFWQRWHITLSRFFRNYVYFSLGGNRLGLPRQAANLLIVFFLTGLWHGAGWTFILWGTAHGVLVLINHLWRRLARPAIARLVDLEHLGWAQWRYWASRTVTLASVILLWVLFRATDMTIAAKFFDAMAHPFVLINARALPDLNLYPLLWLAIAAFGMVACAAPNAQQVVRWLRGGHQAARIGWQAGLVTGLCLYLALSSIARVQSTFIYFNF